ncbi:hypothetical protein AYL99_07470 [Fonsecaea erecta]|uniref:Uncharacterized protein n=1 Tax=Fonsecaea erecta TaxID=1367422 RepID=A0A178ZF13_9EURO|nr:hypothetical protein AYL99_07470 [Fonsecaea erecta]OAP58380.1 hypothetical protein AYL99_07470 [Fonsecaea erecta]
MGEADGRRERECDPRRSRDDSYDLDLDLDPDLRRERDLERGWCSRPDSYTELGVRDPLRLLLRERDRLRLLDRRTLGLSSRLAFLLLELEYPRPLLASRSERVESIWRRAGRCDLGSAAEFLDENESSLDVRRRLEGGSGSMSMISS